MSTDLLSFLAESTLLPFLPTSPFFLRFLQFLFLLLLLDVFKSPIESVGREDIKEEEEEEEVRLTLSLAERGLRYKERKNEGPLRHSS